MSLLSALRNLFKKKESKQLQKERVTMSPLTRAARSRELNKILAHNKELRKKYTPKKDTGDRRRKQDTISMPEEPEHVEEIDPTALAIGLAISLASISDNSSASTPSDSFSSGGGDFGGGGASSDY